MHYPVGKLLREAPYKDGGGTFAIGPIVCLVLLFACAALPPPYFFLFSFESLGDAALCATPHPCHLC